MSEEKVPMKIVVPIIVVTWVLSLISALAIVYAVPSLFQGDTGPQGSQGDAGLQGATGPKGDKGDTGATGPPGVSAPRPQYWISGALNTNSRDVTTTWTKLDNFLTFTKELNESVIEVVLASRATGGSFSGALGVVFEVRINDQPTTMANRGAITTTNTIDFITINAIYTNLTAGTYTVSVWAWTGYSGSSSGVLLDPGGWGGRIIVKEGF